MKFLGNKATAMPLAAVAAMLAFGVPQADAQGLFERLFGGGIRHSPQGDFPPPPSRQKPKYMPNATAPAASRISSPSYYSYKSDPLVRVDFSPLTATPEPAMPQDAAFQPYSATSAAFREAIAGLDDYELYAEKDIAKALIAYYSANPDFIWVTGASANSRAQDAVRVLGEATSYGLTPADYTV
ncbi:MAG: hypothetical protein E5V25_28635, partial [Mesorhizobium sp.]